MTTVGVHTIVCIYLVHYMFSATCVLPCAPYINGQNEHVWGRIIFSPPTVQHFALRIIPSARAHKARFAVCNTNATCNTIYISYILCIDMYVLYTLHGDRRFSKNHSITQYIVRFVAHNIAVHITVIAPSIVLTCPPTVWTISAGSAPRILRRGVADRMEYSYQV
jgi:hypothetical protein